MTKNDSVHALVQRLLSDRTAMIRATVANNPAEVKQHWEARTDRQESANAIADQLVAMWNSGRQNDVISIINVPFFAGKGDDLDKAFAYMRGEVAEMSNDSGNGAMQRAMRMGPTWDYNDIDTLTDGATSTTGTTGGGGSAGGSSTFNWTNFLNTLPGIISAFAQGSSSGSSATNTSTNGGAGQPQAKGVPTWVWVVGGIVAIGLAVFAVVKLSKSN